MKNLLILIQIFVSLLLIFFIVLQSKGTGLGSSFGGKGDLFSTKRGIEKAIFVVTIFLVVVFILSSITQILTF